MQELLIVGLVIGLYLALQIWILPKLGIST